MTRTFIRHTLSAFAAVALVSVFASSPASAWQINQMMSNISKADSDAKLAKPRPPKGLAAQQSPVSRSVDTRQLLMQTQHDPF